MSNKIEYQELIAFHPGYYIKDLLEDQGITQEELAKRLQTTPKYVSELVNGQINLTEEMIRKLSIVFDTSTVMWMNLNEKYIEKKLEIEKRCQLDKESDLVKLIDYKFWVTLGLVKHTRSSTEKAQELQRFFRVSSLYVLQDRDFLVQFKTGIPKIRDVNVINANAWVQTAINIGTSYKTKPFDKRKLKSTLPEIRSMTVQKPADFLPRLGTMLSDCGVAFVLLPNLRNCGVNGAVKWLGKNKVILALNDRRKYADVFWFALFHELGHVFQQRLTMLIVSDTDKDELKEDTRIQKLENEANIFSCNELISKEDYENFLHETDKQFTPEIITSFADRINILPGIVVGRLQHDGYLEQQTPLNALKRKYIVTIS